jgi:hypothetical protein
MIRARVTEMAAGGRSAKQIDQAAMILEGLATSREFAEFLTLASYELLD